MYKGAEHTEVFDKAMANIRYAVDFKKKHNLDCTLGIRCLMLDFADEIIPFAKLAVDLGGLVSYQMTVQTMKTALRRRLFG